jgi:ABC-type branched-subunit amino acid transport system substrate-binding protein
MRRAAAVISLALVAAACTSGGERVGRSEVPHPTGATSPGPTAIVLDVVATVSGPAAGEDSTYLEGIRLAVSEASAAAGGRSLAIAVHDDRGSLHEATALIDQLASGRPAAILYVGPGPALVPARPALEGSGTPVMLLQGDLYTGQALFREVFQVSVPWVWQVNVIARYLVRDRKAVRVVFAGAGPEAQAAMAATRTAMQYWGGDLAGGTTLPSGGPFQPARRLAAGADAVIVDGTPSDSLALAGQLEGAGARVAGPAGLLASAGSGGGGLPPGTVACYTYTWDGWAERIPRVARFVKAISGSTGHDAGGLEQEGYDAVRAVVEGLRRTHGTGGTALTAALEGLHSRTYSSFPVDLGPDDHLFLPRDELGLFAMPGPGERLDPWQRRLGETWRPIMRTFTYDGRRDNILDIDRRVFFPFWRKGQPGPYYWQSRFGIVTGPSDPLH